MKISKYTKFEIETSKGCIDITDDVLSVKVYDANGKLIEKSNNEKRLLELDKKYEKILKDIVSK